MATRTKNSKKTPAKKKETKKEKALPTAARTAKAGKVVKAKKTATTRTSGTPAKKKIQKPAKAVLKKSVAKQKKPAAKAEPKAASAKKKIKPLVKSKNTKPTVKKKTKTTTKTAEPKSAKTTKPTKSGPNKSGAAEKIAKATRAGKPVAARLAENARSSKSKNQEAAKPATVKENQKSSPSVPSETAAKVAKSLIRRKAAKKSETRKTKPARPIAFTLDEALEIAKTKPEATSSSTIKNNGNSDGAHVKGRENQKKEVPADLKQENRTLGAASISDILGYNPNAGPKQEDANDIPPKFARYYKLLLELRQHVISGLDIHTKETLKRSSKEDSGNLSAYSQHMADAGTDTFDRDFALSLVSSEQDALYEIEDAIRRIKRGSYGICEITGKPIKKERLLAVPFAKFSVEGQVEYERTHRKSAYRGGAFGDSTEESVKFMDEDSDE